MEIFFFSIYLKLRLMKKALSITTSLQEKVKFNKITHNQKKSTVNNRRSTIQHNLVFKSSQEVLSFMEMFFLNEFWKKICLSSRLLSYHRYFPVFPSFYFHIIFQKKIVFSFGALKIKSVFNTKMDFMYISLM